ncbi:YndM family protein [Bacillus sp. V59.32b]|uniref:YndM family protein n=1 Tax=Bacillus sp. V59.32b TaxID=1758642 RepID=UPI001356B313|nr:YndM family protein [Bacillus sp. V59.32b]
MEHVRSIVIKYVFTLAILYVILGIIFDMSFTNVLLTATVVTVAEYIIGDLLILPRTNNTIATAADFGLALFVIWAMIASLTDAANPFVPALIASATFAVFEYVFHKYFANTVLDNGDKPRNQTRMQFQTEASEEFSPPRRAKGKKKDRLPRL